MIKSNMKMKSYTSIIIFFAIAQLSSSFMTFKEFNEGKLRRCYYGRGDTRLISDVVNGQTLPLPSSMETFISLVERIEETYPLQVNEMIRRLLVSFRVDGVPDDYRAWDPKSKELNPIDRALFNIDNVNYAWKEDDISEDEQCALHFMLSHTINETSEKKMDNEEELEPGVSKHPREYGVVSLYGKEKHAFSLGKVLLGIYAGILGNNQIEATELYRKIKNQEDNNLNGVKVNRLVAITIGDVISMYIYPKGFKRGEVTFMPNGAWNDLACTTEYSLEDNNKQFVTNSLIRGAVDGLLLGKKLEENQNYFRKLKLSQILRMYYGPTGLIDETMLKADVRSDTQWCKRMDNLRTFQNLNEDMVSYYKFFSSVMDSVITDTSASDISDVLSNIQGSTQIFNEVTEEAVECSRADLEKCITPNDIFPILDWTSNEIQKNFQIELLGILSTSFEVRPKGSTVGAYSNLSPFQTRGLHVLANNTGIASCPSCYARHFKRVGSSKQGDVEVFNNLNQTLTDFINDQDLPRQNHEGLKPGASAKVVLLFNFANPTNDHRLREAVWEIKKNFREVTVLAIGTSKELHVFTENDDTDIFTDTVNAAALANKLKSRICKVPAEFQFKECRRSNRGTEADNKQTGFIPVNKKQYWAMYPKYFLKSYGITMRFKALDGAQIKVCFSRSYFRIVEDGQQHKVCVEPGEEAVFTEKNPCYRYNEHNCDPFYFSVEGMKSGSSGCASIYCRTPKDIAFEFSHEGISCNAANFISSSILLLLLCGLLLHMKGH